MSGGVCRATRYLYVRRYKHSQVTVDRMKVEELPLAEGICSVRGFQMTVIGREA